MNRLAFGLLASSIAASASAQTLYGPTPYLSLADSPFSGLPGFAVEDFEDGMLNTPGIGYSTSASGFIIPPDFFTDSVDADDGVIDGFGRGGHSLLLAGSNGNPIWLTLTFSDSLIGFAPKAVGFVLTDGVGRHVVTAFDGLGTPIASVEYINPDGDIAGGTTEDRFIGFAYAGGIGSIQVYHEYAFQGMEVDHIQYAVPAPGSVALLGLGGLALTRRRR